jgi:HlyD family secretion protein
MTLVRVALVVVAVLGLAGCNTDRPPVLQGWVEADLIFVGPDEAGRIETLNVRQGDHVELRALLLTLDSELQQADLQVQEAALKNAQLAYDRAVALVRTNAGTQKAVEDAEAAQRTAQARLNSAKTRLERRKLFSPVEGSVEQLYYRVGEMVSAGRPVVALLPPGNVKIRFFVAEAKLPEIRIDDAVGIHCDGCAEGLTAKISFISRSSEFTPPVIYSLEERNKLVFMIEARPDQPERFRVGQPVSVSLASSRSPSLSPAPSSKPSAQGPAP